MRVTQNMLNRNALYWMSRNLERLAEANKQLSTGRRVNTVSDDVLASGSILHLERESETIQTYLRNLDAANAMLSFATSSLQSVSEAISRLKELAVQAATETYTDANRQAMAAGVDNLLSTLMALGNLQQRGAYVFSGEAIRTTPFVATTDPAGEIQSVTYQGAMITTEVTVGPRTTSEVNLVGKDIFQGVGDIFLTAIELRDAMRAGDQSEITRLIGELDVSHTDIRHALGRLGERQSQSQVLRAASEGFLLRNQQVISDHQDADVAELAVEFNTLMARLQMVMKVAADIVKPSIFEFL